MNSQFIKEIKRSLDIEASKSYELTDFSFDLFILIPNRGTSERNKVALK
jgi:hypothetical protein